MMNIRKSTQRGLANHGWLKSHHTFSFADYYDASQMGFRSLRVINEDKIAAGTGFGAHPHRDMEIISYVVKGALEHKDSMGNVSVIRPGDVQRMSAGTGVTHSESNKNSDGETHFFQIWITPKEKGIAPGYGQKSFTEALQNNKLVLVISPDGREGSISIHQDANVYISRLEAGQTIEFPVSAGRGVWTQVVSGHLQLNDHEISSGDGASSTGETRLRFKAIEKSEVMIFDLA